MTLTKEKQGELTLRQLQTVNRFLQWFYGFTKSYLKVLRKIKRLTRESCEDLEQQGFLGFVQGIKTFRQGAGTLKSYLKLKIRGAILDAMREASILGKGHYKSITRGTANNLCKRPLFLINDNGEKNSIVPTKDNHTRDIEHEDLLRAALPEEDIRKIFYDYFIGHKLMREIASEIGCSETRVSQLIKEYIPLLRIRLTLLDIPFKNGKISLD